ncbi:hypothetical protein EBZ38_02880 [bacterium]|nr:hypothetical protein [bacterium]NDD83209.1 hypothetical protein [bacterium]
MMYLILVGMDIPNILFDEQVVPHKQEPEQEQELLPQNMVIDTHIFVPSPVEIQECSHYLQAPKFHNYTQWMQQ